MSSRASAYAKTLVVCPNGERVTRGEKLVLISLADSHQDKGKRFTYPSLETIAVDALCDRRTCQRHMVALERKGVIRRLRPAGQGAGMNTFYFFSELESIPEGWQNAALFSGDSSAQKGGGRAAEGRQKGGISRTASITNTNSELKLKASTPPAPPRGGGECRHETTPEAGKEISPAVRLAVDQAMQACGFTKPRLRKVLQEQILRECDVGEMPATTALRLIDAWKRYERAGTLLRARWGPANFFSEGHWRSEAGWMWDNQALREAQRAVH